MNRSPATLLERNVKYIAAAILEIELPHDIETFFF